MDDDVGYRRLRWRSRRGLRELDLLLVPFVEEVYPALAAPEREAYQRLLEQEDSELQAWFNGLGESLDPELTAMVARIKTHTRDAHTCDRQ